ncbi:polysaccharide deacetylase [Nitrosopumilus zosterae]|uniref:Polysaccharide deacetylase n=1 Tax=Nitrosopumilus zosterae TaxID=718286 RepID=A0A2S2KU69_9ARCH|nr:polysaccharide deacetylase family protein [Nitrosopumilus zosterae]BDQ31829.1 polysaccharide deacetylase family protein [Nitrosopumilus zosterae]GBH35179.1 polysaccharide deacetylase [Nitrosopumilus zosterae]
MNLLGIDFEDWYHPQLVEPFVPDAKKIPTMFKGLDKILELLRKYDIKATFFLVGELLSSNPEILDKILADQHEIGFHTMKHTRLDVPNFKPIFKEEIKEFNKITSGKSIGFRAPTFSINEKSSWVIDELADNNYKYDSSIIPAKTNLYGIPKAEKSPYKITSENLDKNDEKGSLIEFPLLVTKFLGKTIPAAGGFYLRSLPLKIIKNAIKSYERNEIPSSFYIHSWELTPEFIPKIKLPIKNRFITFHKIEKTFSKMENLFNEFDFTSFNSYFKKI